MQTADWMCCCGGVAQEKVRHRHRYQKGTWGRGHNERESWESFPLLGHGSRRVQTTTNLRLLRVLKLELESRPNRPRRPRLGGPSPTETYLEADCAGWRCFRPIPRDDLQMLLQRRICCSDPPEPSSHSLAAVQQKWWGRGKNFNCTK